MYQATARRSKGYAVWVYPDHHPVERDCLQCVHCQFTWFVEPGSGVERGWCQHCMGPTCGKPGCHECRPFLKQLEDAERRIEFFKAVGV